MQSVDPDQTVLSGAYTCLCHMQTAEVQINLCIRAVWSAPLIFAAWIVLYLIFLNSKFQDSS